MNLPKISLVTNVCANDINRIRLIFPHWFSVFGDRISDFTVLLDRALPTGRIAKQNNTEVGISHSEKLAAVESLLNEQMATEPRMGVLDLPTGASRVALGHKWFGVRGASIDRCQGGTPIAAFIAAFEAGRERFVLRADCDILFYETGWLDAAIALLASGDADMVEPPRHQPDRGDFKVTTRATLIDAPAFMQKILPIKPHSLDPLRTLHRWVHGCPSWLSLEQMLQKERDAGRLRYVVLSPKLGQWLHVISNAEAGLPIMPSVAEAVRLGHIPDSQRFAGWDFAAEAWKSVI